MMPEQHELRRHGERVSDLAERLEVHRRALHAVQEDEGEHATEQSARGAEHHRLDQHRDTPPAPAPNPMARSVAISRTRLATALNMRVHRREQSPRAPS